MKWPTVALVYQLAGLAAFVLACRMVDRGEALLAFAVLAYVTGAVYGERR